jgi:hypothetical protein
MEPFDLAALKAKARQAVYDDVPVFDYACAPANVLALHAALVRYRQWLVTSRDALRLEWHAYEFAGMQLAIDEFDQAVTL